MTTSSPSFDAFYAAYLAQHRHPANRALHLLAKLLMAAAAVATLVTWSPLALAALPIAAVAPCWLGHWLFERNRPTAWTRPGASLLGTLALAVTGAGHSRGGRPWYSFAADVRMCAGMLGLGGRARRPQ